MRYKRLLLTEGDFNMKRERGVSLFTTGNIMTFMH